MTDIVHRYHYIAISHKVIHVNPEYLPTISYSKKGACVRLII